MSLSLRPTAAQILGLRSQKMSKRNHRATGPRTAAGKAVSSQNARTHGLTATTLHLSPEDRERFQNLRRELTTEVARTRNLA